MTVSFSFDDEPSVNSKDELSVATSGSQNLRRRSGADPALRGRRYAGLQLPFKDAILLAEIIDARTHMFLAHCSNLKTASARTPFRLI